MNLHSTRPSLDVSWNTPIHAAPFLHVGDLRHQFKHLSFIMDAMTEALEPHYPLHSHFLQGFRLSNTSVISE